MLDKTELLELATRLSFHCPRNSNNCREVLAALAVDWEEDFRNFPDEAIRAGFRYARRTCRFFPSTAELIECIRRAHTELDKRQAALLPAPDENPASAENCARGLAHIAAIRERLDMRASEKGKVYAVS